MNVVLLFDRVIKKVSKEYRKYVFRKRIGCKHRNFSVGGNVSLLNTNIKIGQNVSIFPDVMLFGDGLIEIGDNVCIGNGTMIYASKQGGGVSIGHDTLVAAQCYIIDSDHGIRAGELIRQQPNKIAPVSIGNDVWLAAGCKVLRGSIIHDGAVVGASAIVKSELPENSISAGIPSKVIGQRR